MNIHQQYFLATAEPVRGGGGSLETVSKPIVTTTRPPETGDSVAPTSPDVKDDPASSTPITPPIVIGAVVMTTPPVLTVDAKTGEILPSGGGGGGGYLGGSNKRAGVPLKKTIIPLVVLAAGVAMLILKPLK